MLRTPGDVTTYPVSTVLTPSGSRYSAFPTPNSVTEVLQIPSSRYQCVTNARFRYQSLRAARPGCSVTSFGLLYPRVPGSCYKCYQYCVPLLQCYQTHQPSSVVLSISGSVTNTWVMLQQCYHPLCPVTSVTILWVLLSVSPRTWIPLGQCSQL